MKIAHPDMAPQIFNSRSRIKLTSPELRRQEIKNTFNEDEIINNYLIKL